MGCGTSQLGPQIAADHKKLQVHCLDFSLDGLRMAANKCESDCSFVSCDVTEKLPFASSSVGLIVDKGTCDAVIRKSKECVDAMLKEMVRVLCSAGKLVQITTDTPDIRLDIFRGLKSEVAVSYEQLETHSSNMPVYLYEITKIS